MGNAFYYYYLCCSHINLTIMRPPIIIIECRILQKYHTHDNGPAICCVWHPLNSSTLFTSGWDGVIKMWE
jgi:hypothetical protein